MKARNFPLANGDEDEAQGLELSMTWPRLPRPGVSNAKVPICFSECQASSPAI
jgi:hypothetical protein